MNLAFSFGKCKTNCTCSLCHFIALETLIKKLEKRAKKVEKGVGRFLTKSRVNSTDSSLPPPPDAPVWTLKQSYYSETQALSDQDSASTSDRQQDTGLTDTPLSSHQPVNSNVRRRLSITAVHQLLNDEDNSSNSSSEFELN